MTELEPANHRDRAAATGVDLLLVALVGAATFGLTGAVDPSLRLGLLLLAVGLPTFVVEGMLGRSPGKVGVQLRHDPSPLSIPQVAGRYVLKWVVPTVLLVLGLWLPAIVWWAALYLPALTPTHRTTHDRLTRTAVLGPTEQQRADGRAHDY